MFKGHTRKFEQINEQFFNLQKEINHINRQLIRSDCAISEVHHLAKSVFKNNEILLEKVKNLSLENSVLKNKIRTITNQQEYLDADITFIKNKNTTIEKNLSEQANQIVVLEEIAKVVEEIITDREKY